LGSPIISDQKVNEVATFNFRILQQEDNMRMAEIIRSALKERGVDKPGTVFTDPTTDDLFALFQSFNSRYIVAEENGRIVGGSGVFPTTGLPEKCAELVKLYVDQNYRNQGIGIELMKRCEGIAREMGYSQLYLETLPELERACSLYERMGYRKLSSPLGDSGHFACSLWMLKNL
jgi:putative acetyltransferase